MSELLEHLGRDTLPRPLVEDFVSWCINEQAVPALTQVLKEAGLMQQVADIYRARNLQMLAALCIQTGRSIKQARARHEGSKRSAMPLSAAEAAVFEFTNLIRSATEKEIDAESMAFFSARLAGWAGWAAGHFSDTVYKVKAESSARQAQESKLRDLWQQYASR